MTGERTITLRSIQHYMYCPRRFALLELNCDWAENAAVVKADLLHEHVHDGSHRFTTGERIVRSDLTVYHDAPEYDLYGKPDCVEFIPHREGVGIPLLEGRFQVRIVEYKPCAPKDALFHETDAIHVFAQKICADFVWGCKSEAYLYYADIRKRVRLPFDTEFAKYDALLKTLLCEMRALYDAKRIPPRRKKQYCSGCSIAELCFHKPVTSSVRKQIEEMREGGTL